MRDEDVNDRLKRKVGFVNIRIEEEKIRRFVVNISICFLRRAVRIRQMGILLNISF